jgi:hypothetical protein
LVSFWCGDFVVLLHTNSILGWPYCSDPKLNLDSVMFITPSDLLVTPVRNHVPHIRI